MEDLSQKLAGILNDPESMERVRKMAEGLFSQNEASGLGQPDTTESGTDALPDTAALMRVIQLFKKTETDNRSGLLLALRPHLSQERQGRVDKAIKILKLVSLMPILKEQGLLNL